MRQLRIGLAQVNVTVGDVEGNTRRVLDEIERARPLGVDLVAFPELCLTGYPPEDLLFRSAFIEANLRALDRVARASAGLTVVVGFVDRRDDIMNAAAVCHDGQVAGVYHKQYLPNYGVFDEDRYFQAGVETPVFELGEDGPVLAVNICEDIWYPTGPTTAQTLAGAELVVSINSSPYHVGKVRFREKMLATRAADHVGYLAFVNLVGGQDELVFDGQSMVFDPAGDRLALGRAFEEDLVVADLDLDAAFRARLRDSRRRKEKRVAAEPVRRVRLRALPERPRPPVPTRSATLLDREPEVYAALVRGTGDYVRKNGFRRVVVGLSGGIDSALTAAIAVDALGREGVVGVSMPSPFSSAATRADARRVARSLGIEFLTLPITPAYRAFRRVLAAPFKGLKEDVAEENVQARVRGTLLMALSNKFGWLVLTTGNKSEMGVGYCTLYGDMAGGFAVIKDVPKTMVYALARWRNARDDRPVIPESVIRRAAVGGAAAQPDGPGHAAALRGAGSDPRGLRRGGSSLADIVALGYDEATVRQVVTMVDRNEYKRRQAPPGVKITPRAFGRDWRLPLSNRFRHP